MKAHWTGGTHAALSWPLRSADTISSPIIAQRRIDKERGKKIKKESRGHNTTAIALGFQLGGCSMKKMANQFNSIHLGGKRGKERESAEDFVVPALGQTKARPSR